MGLVRKVTTRTCGPEGILVIAPQWEVLVFRCVRAGSGMLFLTGRGVAQPGLARHLGVVEVARSNRVAPIFWPEGQKIERRKESSRTGELLQGSDYPTRYTGRSVSLLSFLLGLLSPALLTSGSPALLSRIDQENEFHFRGCGISLILMMDLHFHRGFRNVISF